MAPAPRDRSVPQPANSRFGRGSSARFEEATGVSGFPWSEESGRRIDALFSLTPSQPPPGIRALVVAPGDGPNEQHPHECHSVLTARPSTEGSRRPWSIHDDDVRRRPDASSQSGGDQCPRCTTEEGAPLWIRTRPGRPRRARSSRTRSCRGASRRLQRAAAFSRSSHSCISYESWTAEPRWRTPPLRASFVFDDPNLRRASYGFVRYAELARHADRYGYHAAMATIPLDARVRAPRPPRSSAADDGTSLSSFTETIISATSSHALSRGGDDAMALAAQALRRIESPRASDRQVPVARATVPPHGALLGRVSHERCCGQATRAVCTNSPYPWALAPPRRPSGRRGGLRLRGSRRRPSHDPEIPDQRAG